MATTAPGSPYVESSDLVANYPAVSEALAERVDTVGVLPFATSTARGTAIPSPTEGQYSYLQDTNATEYWNGSAWVAAGVAPGLVHINTTTFSAVSSVSLDNVFTSDYDNYKIIMSNLSHGTGNAIVYHRLRASGTDSTTLYYWQKLKAEGGSITAAYSPSQSTWSGPLVGLTYGTKITTEIYEPALARVTMMYAQGGYIGISESYYGGQQITAAYDGITLYPDNGTFSGTIRVYGYSNGA